MLSSAKLKEIVSEARPIIERQLDDSERIAGFRDMVSANGGDWSALKALIKAQIQDERDDSGEGKRVRKILEKAEYSTDYAELLGWSNMNEQNFSADDEDFDPSTGEITEPLPPKAAGQGLAEPALMLGSSQPANIKSAPITEQQDAPHPASDLIASPELPQGQVAPQSDIGQPISNELPPASRGIAGEDDLRELAATVLGQIAQEGDAPLEASENVTGEGMSGHTAHLSTDLPETAHEVVGGVASACSAIIMRRELDVNASENGVTGGESAAAISETGKPVEASASAAPLSFAEKIKLLRPNCQHPEVCRSSGGKAHCGRCDRAAENGSAA